MSVDRSVSSSPCQGFRLLVWNVAVFGHVPFRKAEVHHVHFLHIPLTHAEVVRLYIPVDELLLMQVLDPREHLIS